MEKPKVGQHIRVTTRYREHYIYAENEYRENTYVGVVHRPEPWYKDGQFKLVDDEPSRMVYRTLDMSNVVRLEVVS